MKIKISNKWLKKKFKCDKDIIKNVCKGRCCKGTKKLLISLLPEEEKNLKEKYPFCHIKNNKIIDKKKCYFQDENGFCKLHNTIDKPLGCIVSPFKINQNNTLILRHRYIHFPCFNNTDGNFVYIIFANSLISIVGKEKYEIIKTTMQTTDKDFFIDIEENIYNKLKYLEELKHG